MRGESSALFVWVTIVVVGVWGYVWNIIKIIEADSITGMEIARIIGAFIGPLGAILGFF